MSNQRHIFSYSPALFLGEFQEAVEQGLYIDNSVDCYPYLQSALFEVTPHTMDKPAQRHDLSESVTVVIQSYDGVFFMLDMQDAILQGFKVDQDSVQFDTLYSATLHRAEQTVKAPVATTEAQEAPKKQQRKQKSKEV